MKNRRSLASASKQKGFSLLTGFILVIVLFGALAFFLAGRGVNTAFGTTYANSSKVSSLIASAAYMRTGVDSVVLSGTSPASVSFDDVATTGIFNLDTGAATAQAVDPSVLVNPTVVPTSTEGYWVYGSNIFDMGGVGTVLPDYTIMLLGLKTGVCQQINNTLNGTALTATPTVLTEDIATLVGAPTPASPKTTLTLAAAPAANFTIAANGKPSGCYTTSDGSNVFIHTVYPQ